MSIPVSPHSEVFRKRVVKIPPEIAGLMIRASQNPLVFLSRPALKALIFEGVELGEKNVVGFFLLLLNMRRLLGFVFFFCACWAAGRSFSRSMILGFATIEHPRP